jgi:TolA-binding protein
MSLTNLGEADKACLTYDELNSTFPSPPAQIEQAVTRERARAQCG